jgi:CBS domain-containing protein
MKISDVMTREVATVSSNQTAQECRQFHDSRATPARSRLPRATADLHDHRRDNAGRGVAKGLGPDNLHGERADDHGLIQCAGRRRLENRAEMGERMVRRLPVIDESENLVGIVTSLPQPRNVTTNRRPRRSKGVSLPSGPASAVRQAAAAISPERPFDELLVGGGVLPLGDQPGRGARAAASAAAARS